MLGSSPRRRSILMKLYKFMPLGRIPDMSPFVTKLETYLRMAGIPYETGVGDLQKAPKKKLPYIEDDGRLLADSSVIIEHLKATRGDALDDGRLGPAERAVARAWKALFESDLYFVLAYQRWWRDEDFAVYRPVLLRFLEDAKVPSLLRPLVVTIVRRDMKTQLFQQGVARHTFDEVTALGKQQLDAVADFLGDKPFFLGDRPTSLDATAYAFLIGILWSPFDGELKQYAKGRANLVAYCERMFDAYWRDAPRA
jgi:glutathione S-transferase